MSIRVQRDVDRGLQTWQPIYTTFLFMALKLNIFIFSSTWKKHNEFFVPQI